MGADSPTPPLRGRLAQVICLNPAGNDGARLRVVNVGRVDA
jgi:hypothetical protein